MAWLQYPKGKDTQLALAARVTALEARTDAKYRTDTRALSQRADVLQAARTLVRVALEVAG